MNSYSSLKGTLSEGAPHRNGTQNGEEGVGSFTVSLWCSLLTNHRVKVTKTRL